MIFEEKLCCGLSFEQSGLDVEYVCGKSSIYHHSPYGTRCPPLLPEWPGECQRFDGCLKLVYVCPDWLSSDLQSIVLDLVKSSVWTLGLFVHLF